MASIELRNVSKVFPNEVRALDSLSLEFSDSCLSVVVGPSGSGKTTLLRIIAGLEKPSEGQVFINECDVTNVSPARRNISMVFQNYVLYPHMTVRDNMDFPLRMKNVNPKTISEKVSHVSHLLKIQELLNRYPNQISGGEQQRVALGKAILRDVDAILLDEPLSNLDAHLRVEMRGELRRLQREFNLTIILVTHDQGDAMALGDNMLVLDKGVSQQFGPPSAVYSKPSNVFVASFIGNPPMNILDCEIVEDQCFLIDDEHRISLPIQIPKQLVHHPAPHFKIGIRPEDIEMGRFKDRTAVQGRLSAVENLGVNTLFHVSLGLQKVVGINQDMISDRNQTIDMILPSEKVYWFDKEREVLLFHGF